MNVKIPNSVFGNLNMKTKSNNITNTIEKSFPMSDSPLI